MKPKKSPDLLFSEKIERDGVVLAGFCSNRSTPCNAQIPIINQLAERYERKALVKMIDVDENRDLATSFQITSIPTLIFFKKGIEIQRFVGLQKAEVLSHAIDAILG